MAQTKFDGTVVNTVGELPEVGASAPEFTLVGSDLSDVTLADLAGRKLILNIFPSLDTDVCAASVRKFNEEATKLDSTSVLCVSNGIDNVKNGSSFRSTFGNDYGVKLADGPLAGLLTRAVVVVCPEGKVHYVQLVDEITTEPDYDAAIEAVKAI